MSILGLYYQKYFYALNVLKDRFPQDEQSIASNPEYSDLYERNILIPKGLNWKEILDEKLWLSY